MNTVNRILIVLDVLALLFLCGLFFLFPVPTLQAVGDWTMRLADALREIDRWIQLAVGIVLTAVLIFVCGIILFLELRRPPAKTVQVEGVDGGEIAVSLKTVEQQIAYEIDQLPGILKVRSRASVRKGGVVVEVEVDAAGDVEVPARAAQIVEAVQRAVEERVGVKLTQPPKVRLRAQPRPPTIRSSR